jgi:hypothetical protein
VSPGIAVTTARPDILMHPPWQENHHCRADSPWNSTKSIQMIRTRKMGKENYQLLVSDRPVFPWILSQVPHPGNWVPGGLHPRCFHSPENCCSP